ncbi:hypothetical protein EIP91_000883 [Steccherinum ochraceum]|uniref:Uncharacterized protein n=1 Tax=Steccherinum ochraceum TaxID=92696 RepID=A0A4R0RW13_9APHY|nr:hypothetical protein EIP91_000883 [Steccherinum ochraceum]
MDMEKIQAITTTEVRESFCDEDILEYPETAVDDPMTVKFEEDEQILADPDYAESSSSDESYEASQLLYHDIPTNVEYRPQAFVSMKLVPAVWDNVNKMDEDVSKLDEGASNIDKDVSVADAKRLSDPLPSPDSSSSEDLLRISSASAPEGSQNKLFSTV